MRILETLGELARRGLPDAITTALELVGQLEGQPSPDMHRALRDLLHSRPSGEVEVVPTT